MDNTADGFSCAPGFVTNWFPFVRVFLRIGLFLALGCLITMQAADLVLTGATVYGSPDTP